MAQGIVQKLIGDKRGIGGGIIRPTTANGAEIVGQDLYFNAQQIESLGGDDAPLAVGDVVSYTHTQPPHYGITGARVGAVAVEIARIERAPEATRATGGGQGAGSSVEEQLRASDIYRAI